jgi:putative MATE family efflux protein
MFDVSSEDITEGSLSRALLSIATPLVAQQLVLVGNSVVDLFWVGRLGENAVAAVGLTAPLVGLLAVSSYIAYTGGQVAMSQRVGAGEPERARTVGLHALYVAVALASLLALVMILTAPTLVTALGASTAVAGLAVVYIQTLAIAHIVGGMSDTVEAAFVAWGDSRATVTINVVAVLVNLVLDPFLIFGWWVVPEFGIMGAALATLVAYTVGFGVGLGLAFADRHTFHLDDVPWTLERGTLVEIFTIGVPKAGQETARQLARLVMVAVVSVTAGAPGLAAYTVGSRVATVAFVPARALGGAATSVVGQNLGAANPGRATRATWLTVALGAGAIGLLGVGQWRYPVPLANLFVPNLSAAGLALSTDYLRILAYGYWALGAIYTVEAGFNGARKTQISMLSTMGQYYLVRVPIALVGAFALTYGVYSVFWAVTLSNVVAAVLLCGYFYYSTENGMLARAADTTSVS